MYKDIGKKIKSLAMGLCMLEALATIIYGIFLIIQDMIADGLTMIFLGPIVAWLSSLLLYGFGELIDKVCDIERNTRGNLGKSETQSRIDSERINKIEKLRAEGLITEDEYKQAISKEV